MSLLDRTRSRLLIEHKVTSPRLKIAKKGTITKTKPIKIFLYCGVVTSCIFCQLIPHLSFKFWCLIPKLLQNLIPDPVNFYDPWIQSELDKLRILKKKTEKKCFSFWFLLQLVTSSTNWRIKVGSSLFFRVIIISIMLTFHLRVLITIHLVINF